jgi:hypothetical protein
MCKLRIKRGERKVGMHRRISSLSRQLVFYAISGTSTFVIVGFSESRILPATDGRVDCEKAVQWRSWHAKPAKEMGGDVGEAECRV